MPGMNEAQIKAALAAAKGLDAAREARRNLDLRQANLSQRLPIRANRRAVGNLLTPLLTKAGLELDEFEKIRAHNQAELRRLLEQQKAEAIQQSSSVKRTLRSEVASLHKLLQQVTTLAPPDAPPTSQPFYVLLETPFLIWPTHGIFLDDSHVEPVNSWAKISLSSGESAGYEELGFYFLWENPSDRVAVINVDAYIAVNGFCSAGANGGTFPDDRHSSLVLNVRLNPWQWWDQPPTQPMPQGDQSQQVLSLYAFAGGWFDVGDIEVQSIFRGYDLSYTSFIIPPNGVVVFETTLSISYGNSEGFVQVDLASGDFEVLCPAVLIAILT
ncbi:MAG TPA: hypothetical protein VFB38_00115 [Chthonomonadaceae bacterium]|nr:hypothetical protein [Chthonomonadaceae bacterium]